MAKEDRSPFVAIGASLGGILMIISVLFLIFAKDQLEYLASIAWGFVVLGIFLGFFAFLSLKKKR